LKTIILGLGNPILSDDSAGFRVAQLLKGKFDKSKVTVIETDVAGLSLLDLLVGYDRAIIIDAIQTAGGKAGQIYRLDPTAFNDTRHFTSPHDVNFATALELGNKLGLVLPQQISIFAIEAADVTTSSEECTPDVEQAISVATEMVIQELNGGNDA